MMDFSTINLGIQQIRENTFLSHSINRSIATTTYANDDKGYGWHVSKTERGGMMVNRGGGLPAFESELAMDVDEKAVVIFTINNHIGLRMSVIKGIEQAIGKH